MGPGAHSHADQHRAWHLMRRRHAQQMPSACGGKALLDKGTKAARRLLARRIGIDRHPAALARAQKLPVDCWRGGDHATACDLRTPLVELLRDAAHSPLLMRTPLRRGIFLPVSRSRAVLVESRSGARGSGSVDRIARIREHGPDRIRRIEVAEPSSPESCWADAYTRPSAATRSSMTIP